MYKFDGYMNGANLGHWISQFPLNSDKQYFDTFIQEKDFKRMAEWGLDHIRVPVDYFIFEKDENPGVYDEYSLKYIDFALECCKKYKLNMVLDLHHAPGFTFTAKFDKEKNNLFTNEKMQQRFINIWKMFANRYKNEGDNITFELLNELVSEDSESWNKLWQRTADEIFKINPERNIIIGSNLWNSCDQLKYLTIVDNPRIIYNFHTYSPFIFTHQRADWEQHMFEYTKPVSYPFYCKDHQEFIDKHFSDTLACHDFIDKKFLYESLKPALDFINEHKRPIYCGEFGVIEYADMESTIRWLDDMTAIFNEYGIGHAVWSYRGFHVIAYDDENLFCEDIIKLISRK